MAAEPREIWRDRWLVVIDKPSGVPTQATRRGEIGVYERLAAVERYVGLHHRLDQPASGLVLLTVDPAANAAIAAGFRDHTIGRVYRAVLVGDADDGVWDRPVDGRPARTFVRGLGHGGGLSAVELTLDTGRTHQIRQHAALAGRPIAGDRKYGGDAGRRWPRLALHAARLALAHPITGEALSFESAMPDDLRALWAEATSRPRREG